VGRLRALSLVLDAVIFACLVDAPAFVVLGVAFLFFPDVRLVEIGSFAFILFVLAFLARDTRGGFSRKWLGFKIEDERGRPPGWVRSVLRNAPLVVPGWNLWEAISVLRDGDRPRPIDRLLGLRFREMP
jgi:hypothetical protein